MLFRSELDEYSKRRLKAGIKTHAVYTLKAGRLPHVSAITKYWRFVPEEKLPIGADIVVFDDKVALMAHKGKVMGVIMENEEIAKSMRAMYQIIWKSAEEYQ